MKTILITGASSGIGKALAFHYADDDVVLFLGGRNIERLRETAAFCEQKGAVVYIDALDVTDVDKVSRWINKADGISPLDLVIANAGISAGPGGKNGESEEQIRQIFNTNLGGVINTVLPTIPLMRKRGKGQIAMLASLAGYRGVPSAPAYSGSKGGVKIWGEALRGWLAKDGIKVSVICPGFVKSGITTKNKFPMPFLMEANQAAAIIARGLTKNKARITFPWQMAFISWLMMVLPIVVSDFIYKRLPLKE